MLTSPNDHRYLKKSWNFVFVLLILRVSPPDINGLLKIFLIPRLNWFPNPLCFPGEGCTKIGNRNTLISIVFYLLSYYHYRILAEFVLWTYTYSYYKLLLCLPWTVVSKVLKGTPTEALLHGTAQSSNFLVDLWYCNRQMFCRRARRHLVVCHTLVACEDLLVICSYCLSFL